MEIAKNAGITYKQTPVANGTLVKVIKAAMASQSGGRKGLELLRFQVQGGNCRAGGIR